MPCLTNKPRNNAETQRETKETVMFTSISRNTQNVVCMVLSAVIVSASLSLGAFAADRAAHDGYSVTVTQIQ